MINSKQVYFPEQYNLFSFSTGTTPAYFAAQEGRLECFQHLVDQGKADPVASCNDGMTPAHCAAQGGHLNIIQVSIVLTNHLQNRKKRRHWQQNQASCEYLFRNFQKKNFYQTWILPVFSKSWRNRSFAANDVLTITKQGIITLSLYNSIFSRSSNFNNDLKMVTTGQ